LVSWGRSFKAAIVLLIFTIIWIIIGGLIMFTGSLLVPIGGFYIDPLTGLPVIDWGLAFSAVIFWIIGSLFILLGVYASFFKVNTELLIEELKKEITF